jgi:hypothetical protein
MPGLILVQMPFPRVSPLFPSWSSSGASGFFIIRYCQKFYENRRGKYETTEDTEEMLR